MTKIISIAVIFGFFVQSYVTTSNTHENHEYKPTLQPSSCSVTEHDFVSLNLGSASLVPASPIHG